MSHRLRAVLQREPDQLTESRCSLPAMAASSQAVGSGRLRSIAKLAHDGVGVLDRVDG